MELELIGEFKGKNTVYRVLPDGKIETSGQGIGKILGVDAFIMSTAAGTMSNGVFAGEESAIITTTTGDSILMKGTVIGYPSGEGGVSRGGTVQMTQSQNFSQLNKVVCLSEFVTDMADNWVGKIWQLK